MPDHSMSPIIMKPSTHDGAAEENGTNPAQVIVSLCVGLYENGTQNRACPKHDFWKHIDNQTPHLFLSCLGIVNNALSLIFFFQPQFKGRVLARMLRYYYISNLVGSLTFVVNKDKDLITYSIRHCTGIISIGLMTYISVLRYISIRSCINPARFSKRDILILICIILLAFGIVAFYYRVFLTQNEQGIIVIAICYTTYHLLVTVVAMVLNTLTLCMEWAKQRCIASESNPRSRIMPYTLTKYIIISSVLNAVSTIPYSIFAIYSALQRGKPKSCDTCAYLLIWESRLLVLHFMNLYLDNTLYLILSKEYRHGLFFAIERMCYKLLSKVSVRELTRTSAPSMANPSPNIDEQDDENSPRICLEPFPRVSVRELPPNHCMTNPSPDIDKKDDENRF